MYLFMSTFKFVQKALILLRNGLKHNRYVPKRKAKVLCVFK